MSGALALSSATARSSVFSLSSVAVKSPSLDSFTPSSIAPRSSLPIKRYHTNSKRTSTTIRCEVALKSTSSSSFSVDGSGDPSSSLSDADTAFDAAQKAKVGAKVKVTAPLKVYHVVRVPEIELTGMEGVIKDYVAVWKGKRISANFPFKVQFVKAIEGRGDVKFFAHLREDEFEYLE